MFFVSHDHPRHTHRTRCTCRASKPLTARSLCPSARLVSQIYIRIMPCLPREWRSAALSYQMGYLQLPCIPHQSSCSSQPQADHACSEWTTVSQTPGARYRPHHSVREVSAAMHPALRLLRDTRVSWQSLPTCGPAADHGYAGETANFKRLVPLHSSSLQDIRWVKVSSSLLTTVSSRYLPNTSTLNVSL